MNSQSSCPRNINGTGTMLLENGIGSRMVVIPFLWWLQLRLCKLITPSNSKMPFLHYDYSLCLFICFTGNLKTELLVYVKDITERSFYLLTFGIIGLFWWKSKHLMAPDCQKLFTRLNFLLSFYLSERVVRSVLGMGI